MISFWGISTHKNFSLKGSNHPLKGTNLPLNESNLAFKFARPHSQSFSKDHIYVSKILHNVKYKCIYNDVSITCL